MIRCITTVRVGVAAAAAFDVIATNVCENNPKWEPEVVELRRLTKGPIGVGSRLLMVRQEFGRRSEVICVVDEFEPSRRVVYSHADPRTEFHLTFEIAPVAERSCDVRVSVAMRPPGPARPLTPLLRLVFPRRTRRIARSMAAVVEREGRGAGVAVAPAIVR